jgi:hypothetical protein
VVQWYVPIISAPGEAKEGGSQVQSQAGLHREALSQKAKAVNSVMDRCCHGFLLHFLGKGARIVNCGLIATVFLASLIWSPSVNTSDSSVSLSWFTELDGVCCFFFTSTLCYVSYLIILVGFFDSFY